MKILGVDPGTATTGWAVIDTAGRLLAGRSAGEKIPKVLGCGIITTRAKLPDFERLEKEDVAPLRPLVPYIP